MAYWITYKNKGTDQTAHAGINGPHSNDEWRAKLPKNPRPEEQPAWADEKRDPDKYAKYKAFWKAYHDAYDQVVKDYIMAHKPDIEVISIDRLPYGSGPGLLPREIDGDHGGWFCFQPNSCKGHSSCPRRYACSE